MIDLEVNVGLVEADESQELADALEFALQLNCVQILSCERLSMRCLALPNQARRYQRFPDLPRGSREVFGEGQRDLPFLNDMLTEFCGGNTIPWIGFINSDIILTSEFMPAFYETCAGRDLLLVRVCDIPGRREAYVKNEKRWKPRSNPESIDGVLLRQGSGIEIPDLVVGEPFWDNYVVELARRLGEDRAISLPHRCALHPKHKEQQAWTKGLVYKPDYADWKGLSPAGEHNRRLFLELRDSEEA